MAEPGTIKGGTFAMQYKIPISPHVETIALLTRKMDVERIDIEMAVDKEDVTER